MSRNYKFHNPDGVYFISFADVYLLGYKNPLKWEKNGERVTIDLPAELQNPENRPCRHLFLKLLVLKSRFFEYGKTRL